MLATNMPAAGSAERAQRIHAELRQAIEAGILPVGTKLPAERELAARHGISRKLVRRALDRLREDGLIERRVGSGSFVSSNERNGRWTGPLPAISPLDAVEARRVLEVGAATLVASRATSRDFEELERQLALMEETHDPSTFRAATFAFNLALLRATHNPLLIAMYEMLIAARAHTGWDRLGYLVATAEQRAQNTRSNRQFLELLRAGKGTEAAAFKHQRLSTTIRRILEVSTEE